MAEVLKVRVLLPERLAGEYGLPPGAPAELEVSPFGLSALARRVLRAFPEREGAVDLSRGAPAVARMDVREGQDLEEALESHLCGLFRPYREALLKSMLGSPASLVAESSEEAEWVELGEHELAQVDAAKPFEAALLEAGISLPPVAEPSYRHVVALPAGMTPAEVAAALAKPAVQSALATASGLVASIEEAQRGHIRGRLQAAFQAFAEAAAPVLERCRGEEEAAAARREDLLAWIAEQHGEDVARTAKADAGALAEASLQLRNTLFASLAAFPATRQVRRGDLECLLPAHLRGQSRRMDLRAGVEPLEQPPPAAADLVEKIRAAAPAGSTISLQRRSAQLLHSGAPVARFSRPFARVTVSRGLASFSRELALEVAGGA